MATRSESSSFAITLNSCLILAAVVGISILHTSCENKPTAPTPHYDEPTSYRHSTLPLAVGNQWSFVDSSYWISSPTNAAALIRLTSITSYTEENNSGMWCTSDSRGGPGPRYSISGDTVFVDDSQLNGALLNPRVAFLPPSAVHDTVTIAGPFPYTITKVYPLGHTLTTPAGTFDSVYVYELDQFGTQLTYFRPSIGVIFQVSHPTDSTYVLKSVLASYVLVK